MDALTYALGLSPAADVCLERVRLPRETLAGTPPSMARPRADPEPRWPADEGRDARVRSKGYGSRRAAHVETVLFIVTLAAIACLGLGALPALAL